MTTAAGADALFDADTYREQGLPRTLRERFLVPPFSVLDQRAGYWQERKDRWIALGIRSEEGRDAHMAYKGQESLNAMRAQSSGLTLGSLSGIVPDYYAQKNAAEARVGHALSNADFERDHLVVPDTATLSTTGTSIFDPVLCEIAYRWFSPADAAVLDPFAGGSVRGVVAAALGRTYTGIDLRAVQVDANRQQWGTIGQTLTDAPSPTWIAGDAMDIDTLLPSDYAADLIFSCPPYGDLERYSDDPADLSTMDYPAFIDAYRAIIARAVARLRPDRFVVWVVGEIRDARGAYRSFVPDTIAAMAAAGATYYNEGILISPVGSLAVRVGRQFTVSRKMGKAHQNVLVFVKGDARRAAAACDQDGVGISASSPAQAADHQGRSA